MSYVASSIKTHQGLEIIRKRPSAFLPDLSQRGITHALGEIMDNAFDETSLMHHEGQVDIFLFKDQDTFQVLITDNGRGIPPSKLLEAFTIPHTSGKFNTGSYVYSSGLFGLGAKVAAGLSEKLRVITMREDGEASLFVEKGLHFNKIPVYKGRGRQGVIVILELDKSVFSGMDVYIDRYWFMLLDKIKKYCYFNDVLVNFHIVENKILEDIWKISIAKVLKTVRKYKELVPLFSSKDFNRDTWIKTYFGMTLPFSWKYSFKKTATETSSLACSIEIFYSEEKITGRFGMVNSVSIDNDRSHHLLEIIIKLKEELSKSFQGPLKTFFMDIYKLPVSIAVDVLYSGAEFSGTTKHAFYSPKFREEYGSFLKETFKSSKELKKLYIFIKDDVEEKYLLYQTGKKKIKFTGRLYQDLNHPEKFTDCTTKDRSEAELFIVEGDSAGGGIKSKRNGETQGIYTIRGKPRNGIVDDDFEQTKLILQGDKIYQDLVRILNINIKKPDMRDLYFSKILILCDADPHGKHIVSLLLGNLYALCPELVVENKIKIIEPPYYGLEYVNGKRSLDKKQYVLDKNSLVNYLTENLYMQALDIDVVYNGKMTRLKEDEYKGFIQTIIPIGEMLENLARELVIPSLVLEILTHVTYLLDETLNVEELRDVLGGDQIYYNKKENILTISIDREDYVIPLYRVKERLYDKLLPLMNVINWRRLEVYVTYKNVDNEKRFMLIGQLYEILKQLDESFNFKQYKGLGGISGDDLERTCLDPRSRISHDISSLGDVDTVFKMLGRDTAYRKDIVAEKISD